MPPKLRIKPPSPVASTPATTPTTATHLEPNAQRENHLIDSMLLKKHTSPAPKKKPRKPKVAAKKSGGKRNDETQLLTPESMTDEVTTNATNKAVKQGVTRQPKKAATRKRKADDTESDRNLASAPTKRKKALPKPKPKTPTLVVDSDEDEPPPASLELPALVHPSPPLSDPAKNDNRSPPKLAKPLPPLFEAAKNKIRSAPKVTQSPPSPPISDAVKHKIRAVETFLDSHKPSIPPVGQGNNTRLVHELDLLAALIILCVDYQLDVSTQTLSLDAAREMVLHRHGINELSVDFDKACEIERMVQDKIRLVRGAEGLKIFNFVRVEVEMLLAHREKLAADGFPTAGFRVY